MIDFSDLDDGLTGAPVGVAVDIKKSAHIANGGEATFSCPACGGKGYKMFGYRNPAPRACFKCSGRGTVGKGVAAAAKAKETRERNFAAWCAANADLLTALRGMSDWNNFARDMLAQIDEGRALTENQVAACQRMIANVEAKKEERIEAKKEEAPTVDVSAIQKLFDTATENDVKRPIFRTVDITITKAPMTGNNPGALYVKSTTGGDYLGKIMGGKFFGQRDSLEQLRAVAADPAAEAIKYASKFSRCGICGKSTIDPVSVRSAVGPVCAAKWGLEGIREEARESLAAERDEDGR